MIVNFKPLSKCIFIVASSVKSSSPQNASFQNEIYELDARPSLEWLCVLVNYFAALV